MKNKQKHFTYASFGALLFVILGYVVKFYPDQLTAFDSPIQLAIRGELSQVTNVFWSAITVVGEVTIILALIAGLSLFFHFKKWKAEIYFLVIGMVLLAGASTALKFLYQRPRPTLEWVVSTTGYSFPSWHTASTMMLAGILVVILYQRVKTKWIRVLSQGVLLLLAVLVALSRIYVGVHYPTDIVGGWLLAFVLLKLLYPIYDEKRFTWRFQSKQK
ncbi:phosphatase PAP2 family protein [Streptococcus cameli]